MTPNLSKLAGLTQQQFDIQPIIELISEVSVYNIDTNIQKPTTQTDFNASTEVLMGKNESIPGIHISNGLIESIKAK